METAAGLASMFYIGITFGRFVGGFLAMKLSDKFLIRVGMSIVAVGIAFLFVPFHAYFSLVGFLIIGLGCAPIYPCIIHMTPAIFGADKSQGMIGVQMAFAYVGSMFMPTAFACLAEYTGFGVLPIFGLLITGTMLALFNKMKRIVENKA